MLTRTLRRLFVSFAAFLLASCALAPSGGGRESILPASDVRGASPTVVVLLTLDGARWQEIFDGVDAELAHAQGLPANEIITARELLPNLHALIDRSGAALGAPQTGSEIVASGPNFLSLPGYAELLSGDSAPGCRDNDCAGIRNATLLDELANEPGAVPDQVAAITSWAPLRRVTALAPERVALSNGRYGASPPNVFEADALSLSLLRDGADANPYPGHSDFRPDRLTAKLALRYLEAHRPKFLFVGLGEPDEYAHRNDYRGYLSALRFADGVIGELTGALAELARRHARTTLIVTADHGRAYDFVNHGEGHPESARVWLVATGSEFRARGFVKSPVQRRLADVAPTLRQVFGIGQSRTAGAGEPLLELF